jgi:DNA-binding NarL/FixJ family response regulator
MIKIMIADDHEVVLTGMKLLLESQDDLTIVGQGKNGQEILTFLNRGVMPDLLLTDLHMPGMSGLELIEQVRRLYPSIKIIILSMMQDLSYFMNSLKSGATGYLLKNVDYEEMLFCIRQIVKGKKFVCSDMTFTVINKLQKYPTAFNETHQIMVENGLSDRELEVLKLIGDGFSNAQIADKLFLSKRTIEGHRQSLLEKCASKNTAALIKYAVNSGLIS